MFALLCALALGGPLGPSDGPPSLDHIPDAVAAEIHKLKDRPPTPSEVQGWSAVQYNAHLVSEEFDVMRSVLEPMMQLLENPDEQNQDAFLRTVEHVLVRAAERTRATPEFKKDPALRDAIAQAYDDWADTARRTHQELTPLYRTLPVTAKTVLAVEKLSRELDNQAEQADENVMQVQREFAKRHGYRLLPNETREELLDLPRFTAPGIPPEGSSLNGEAWVVLSSGYLASATEVHNVVVEGMNGLMGAMDGGSDDPEASRKATLVKIRAACAQGNALGPWNGDASVADAVGAECRFALDLLQGGLADNTKMLASGGPKKRKDVDAFNGTVDKLNAGLGVVVNDAIEAQQAFQQTWRFQEYDTFIRERARRAAETLE